MAGPALLNDPGIALRTPNQNDLFYFANPSTGLGGKNTIAALIAIIAAAANGPIKSYADEAAMLANTNLPIGYFAYDAGSGKFYSYNGPVATDIANYSLVGSINHWRGDWDPTGNLFPETGDVNAGDYYYINDPSSTLNGISVPVGSIIIARENNPGQDVNKWSILIYGGGGSGTSIPFGTTTGTNTYASATTPATAAYVNGMLVHIKFKDASTGASTLNLDSVGAKKIMIDPTTQAGNGHLTDEQNYLLSYDSALDGAAGAFLIVGKLIPDADPTTKGIVELATPAEVITGTDTTRAVTAEGVHGKVVGIQDLFIPASYFSPTITDGCQALTPNEIVTSLLNLQTLDFDNTTAENAQYTIVLPRKSTLTSFTFRVYWMSSAGVAAETVRWALKAVAYSHDDPLTGAFGSFVTVDQALTAVNDLHITDETSSVAVASPSSADLIAIQIQRQPASDNLAADARLIGVSMRITTTAAKDA